MSPTSRSCVKKGGGRWIVIIATVVSVSLLASACSSSVKSSKPTTTPVSTSVLTVGLPSAWNSTWSYNGYSSNFPGLFNYFVDQPLAVQQAPSITNFTPELASRWTASGNQVSVYLRQGAKWQNGQPVTSKDLYDTFLLDGAAGFSAWDAVTNVTMPSSHEVTFTLVPGTLPALFETTLFSSVIPYPSSQYGQFVTPTLKQMDLTYFKDVAAGATSLATTPAATTLQAVFKKVAAYSPSSMIGDGPFQLKAISTLSLNLAKWSGFYDANKIHVPAVRFLNASTNSIIYSWMFTGRAMFSDVYMPPNILTQWGHTPGGHVAAPTAGEQQMIFNDHIYPLNIAKVRQALAYITPRAQMVKAAYGSVSGAGGTVDPKPDGLMASIQGLYLSKSQIASLHSYSYSPAKAAALLTSAGFHKAGSTWMLPDGSPFTLSMTVVAAYSDIVTSFEVAAAAWTAFGIKTTETGVPKATWASYLHAGNFQVTNNYMSNYDPLGGFNSDLGTAMNFSTSGNFKGQRGIGFGPTATVPTLGSVNVPATIGKEAALVGAGSQMRSLTWDWARLVNTQVPYLVFANKVFQFSFSTTKFTDWPPLTSGLWSIMSNQKDAGLVLAMEEGFIRPKV